ncbi:MAG: hypothetical protein ACOYYS_26390 [Chloroflexota bacterium]
MKEKLRRWRHAWIALVLVAFNGLAWLGAAPLTALPQAEPRLAPEIARFRDDLWSGQHAGETFHLVITDQMASEAIAWFVTRHEEIPFSHPWVNFTPQGVTGRGLVHLLGLRSEVYGVVMLSMNGEAPVVTLRELGVAGAKAPAAIVGTITTELNKQAGAVRDLPMTITRLELQNGQLVIEGVYK